MFLTLFLQYNAPPIPSTSVLPAKISYKRKDRIENICYGKNDVIKLIKVLDLSKEHGHDGISVKMITTPKALKFNHSEDINVENFKFQQLLDQMVSSSRVFELSMKKRA